MGAGIEAMTNAPPAERDTCSRVVDFIARENGFRDPQRCRAYMHAMFNGISLKGRSVLEVGCGRGWLCLYAAGTGARRVVGLEPAAAGSTSGDLQSLECARDVLGLDQVEARTDTIQTYDPGSLGFDVVVMRSAINHLDEDACVRLQRDPSAREAYREVFAKLNEVMNLGGTLIAADASRYNFFGMLGLTNPLARHIEWHKHQSPRMWASLLRECGFGEPSIEWLTPGPLRRFGRLTGNDVGAFFLNSRFRLVMTKVSEA